MGQPLGRPQPLRGGWGWGWGWGGAEGSQHRDVDPTVNWLCCAPTPVGETRARTLVNSHIKAALNKFEGMEMSF